MSSVSVNPLEAKEPLKYEGDAQIKLDFLGGLIWDYVILNPNLSTQQHGERKIIRTLFRIYFGGY